MPGCWVPRCSNSHSKNYIMVTFPKDPMMRKAWIHNINRTDTIPSRNCCICEVHFPDHMWQQNCPVRLKDDAVPIIFDIFLPPKRRAMIEPGTSLRTLRFKQLKKIKSEHCKDIKIKMEHPLPKKVTKVPRQIKIEKNTEVPIKRPVGRPKQNLPIRPNIIRRVEPINMQNSSISDFNPSGNSARPRQNLHIRPSIIRRMEHINVENPSAFDLEDCIEVKEENPFFESESETVTSTNVFREADYKDWKEKFHKMYKLWDNCDKNCLLMKNQLAAVKAEMKQLELKVETKFNCNEMHDLDPLSSHSNNDHLLERIFNEDQIQILRNQHPNPIKWSQETLRKALRLRVTCGSSGYQELLRQRIPLPSMHLIEEILTLSPTNPEIFNELLRVLKTT